MTRELVGATRSIDWRNWFIAGDLPTMRLVAPARAAQLGDFALQARGFERAFGDQHQAVRLERLFDEIIGAELDRGDRRLDIAVAGNHHDRQRRMFCSLTIFEQLQAVELRALQPDVEEDEGCGRRA